MAVSGGEVSLERSSYETTTFLLPVAVILGVRQVIELGETTCTLRQATPLTVTLSLAFASELNPPPAIVIGSPP